MAYCTKCKKEIDALATECPHCKYHFSEEKVQEDKFKHKFARHTIVAVSIFVAFSYNPATIPPTINIKKCEFNSCLLSSTRLSRQVISTTVPLPSLL